jgi:hypothetical protein
MEKMLTDSEQHEKLFALQRVIGTYEVNTVMNQDPGDVAFVSAVDTPNASQICFADRAGYDVWRVENGKLRLVKTKLDIGAAANIVIMEYMVEKVRRAKRLNPALRSYSDKALLTHLLKGYQSATSAA